MRDWSLSFTYDKQLDSMLEPDDCYYNKSVSREDVRFPSESEMNLRRWERFHSKNKYIEVTV